MNLFIFVATILIIFSNSEAAPTSQRGQPGKQRHHLEYLEVKTSRNGHTIAGEHEPKEASDNLQEEQEKEQEKEKEKEQRQVVKEVKDLLRQLRQLGRWTVKVKSKTARDDETFGQNWVGSEMEPRDLRAGLRSNSHGTLISKGW